MKSDQATNKNPIPNTLWTETKVTINLVQFLEEVSMMFYIINQQDYAASSSN